MKLSTMTLFSLGWNAAVTAWSPRTTPQRGGPRSVGGATRLQARQAGTFFNQVPENDDNDDNGSNNKEKKDGEPLAANDDDDSFETQAAELLRQRKVPSLASQPSTINGKPTAGVGFGQKINPPGDSKPFVGIGPPLNDPTKPEYDDQGYTLYADEKTGAKSRVFEALVDYPCKFTMKIVGADEGNFVGRYPKKLPWNTVDTVHASHILHAVDRGDGGLGGRVLRGRTS